MARINLLPWRDENRRQQNQRFYGIFFFAEMLFIILLSIIYFIIKQKIICEESNICFLEKEQKTIEIEIKMIESLQRNKTILLDRMKVIQDLQAQRFVVVKLLDSLPQVVPQGVRLTGLARKEDIVYLEGQANTNASISRLLKNLEAKELEGLFQDIKLKEVIMNKKESDLRFKIQFKLNNLAENDPP